MEADDGERAAGSKRGRRKGPGPEADLLDLARSVMGMAEAEITSRHQALNDRLAQSRSLLGRAQQSPDERKVPFDELFDRLDADHTAAADLVRSTIRVLDDLAHDLAAVATRFR